MTVKNGYISGNSTEFQGIYIEINKCNVNCETDT